MAIGIAGSFAQENDSIPRNPTMYHGDFGWHFESKDGKYSLNFQPRLQLRYSYPFEVDPVTLDEINQQEEHIIQIRRARIKIGGNAYSSKLNYYLEYELVANNLLDFWAHYAVKRGLNFLIGQYKARFNFERVVSSGRQQTADRSILTRPFTIDRQIGVTMFGNLGGHNAANLSYYLAVLNGTGRGSYIADEESLMYMARLQWNPFGKDVKWHSSDYELLPDWRGHIAFGGVTNESQFTRFSQQGGGQLRGYPDTSAIGQYRINQIFGETVFKKSGFSWQQEFHWKSIYDNILKDERILMGNYVQFGTFPVTYLHWFPKRVEIAGRYSIYYPDLRKRDENEEEATFSINYFFNGHNNKLTTEVSYLEWEDNDTLRPGWRFRLQWDVSF